MILLTLCAFEMVFQKLSRRLALMMSLVSRRKLSNFYQGPVTGTFNVAKGNAHRCKDVLGNLAYRSLVCVVNL